MEEKEIWVDVIGYDGYYEVSNLGRVKSRFRKVPFKNSTITIKERILKQTLKKEKNGNHIPTVMLSVEGKQQRWYVSRLVYCSFNNIFMDEYSDKGYEVCHLDKNCSNNNIKNLSLEKRWVSARLIHAMKGLSETQKKQYQKRIDDYNNQGNRKCKTCEIIKPINDYYRGRKECKVCVRKKMNEYDKRRRLSER